MCIAAWLGDENASTGSTDTSTGTGTSTGIGGSISAGTSTCTGSDTGTGTDAGTCCASTGDSHRQVGGFVLNNEERGYRLRGSIAHGIHANGSMVTTDEWTSRFNALAVTTDITVTTITNNNTTTTTPTTVTKPLSLSLSLSLSEPLPLPASRICVADAEQLLDDFIETLAR